MSFFSRIVSFFTRSAPPAAPVPVQVNRQVKATSFADPKDVAEFHKYYRTFRKGGMSEEGATQRAFKHGDNGIGFTGLDCADPNICYCALPPEVWQARWGDKKRNAAGRRVIVTYEGKEYPGMLGDTMPALANIKNGAGIDLNPGFARALGVNPPFTLQVSWRWAE